MSYVQIYVVSLYLMRLSSKTSTHWKLDAGSGKVHSVAARRQEIAKCKTQPSQHNTANDTLMDLLSQPIDSDNGVWTLKHCSDQKTSRVKHTQNTNPGKGASIRSKKLTKYVDCGVVNEVTSVDYLKGIKERSKHPHLPEPDVSFIFQATGGVEIDLKAINKQLEKEKKENPRSFHVYNRIANFWRIEGNTQKSIECFRKALTLSPNNANVLLYLASILFNLQYLDDAYELAKKSLQSQSSTQNSWMQHFTLAEIFKAKGLHKNAIHHFHLSLDLHPGFQPAQNHLKEIESLNLDGPVTYYTMSIIFMLVFGVLFFIILSIDSFDNSIDVKTQRHFNRAMAMRSMKLGINHKLIRMRKQCNCY